jgi:hypothetical protein
MISQDFEKAKYGTRVQSHKGGDIRFQKYARYCVETRLRIWNVQNISGQRGDVTTSTSPRTPKAAF